MTLRDSAVCASLRRLVIHRFLPLANYSEAPAANCGHFLFAVELGKEKSGVTLESHDN
jgi:hypothetical protein